MKPENLKVKRLKLERDLVEFLTASEDESKKPLMRNFNAALAEHVRQELNNLLRMQGE